jgi:hypothetical protein
VRLKSRFRSGRPSGKRRRLLSRKSTKSVHLYQWALKFLLEEETLSTLGEYAVALGFAGDLN